MHVTSSRDGTRIAYDRAGDGPPLILVAGAFSYRKYPAQQKLVQLLAKDFTVVNYDRRGRGDSGDSRIYCIDREIEDVSALLGEVGAPAYVWGLSSGAALALKAAASGLPVTALALQEPPFVVDPADHRPPVDMCRYLVDLIAEDRRGDAVKYFLVDGMGAPAFVPRLLRIMPGVWRKLTAVAATLPYDAQLVAPYQTGHPLTGEEWAAVRIPSLVMCGTEKDTPAFLRHAAAGLAAVLPDAQLVERKGLGHTKKLSPRVIAETITGFFSTAADMGSRPVRRNEVRS